MCGACVEVVREGHAGGHMRVQRRMLRPKTPVGPRERTCGCGRSGWAQRKRRGLCLRGDFWGFWGSQRKQEGSAGAAQAACGST